MWDLVPRQGSNPGPLHREHRGSSESGRFWWYNFWLLDYLHVCQGDLEALSFLGQIKGDCFSLVLMGSYLGLSHSL